MTNTPVVVICGGAAGMMAALAARQTGAQVTLVEPNEKLGRKLYITGKGRCNLTNNTTPQGVLDQVPRNGRFPYSAVTRFPPAAVMAYFEELGVPLKTERGGRVFPCSDRAADVIDALFFALKRQGVALLRGLSLIHIYFCALMVSLNIGLGIFNLSPFPPLDGSKVVAMFLPDRWYYRWMQLERYGMFILMVALWFGVFDGFLGTARRVLVDWMLQGANGMFQAVLSLLV